MGWVSKLLYHLSVKGKKKKQKQKTAGARSSKMLVLEVTRWEMTENSFHSSNSKRSVQPLFQCLKTSRCCSRLAFPYLCSDNIWKPVFLFSSTFFLWRNIQSYQMQASPHSPTPFSCRQCGMNFKCHYRRKKWTYSIMWASVKLFPVVFFKKN